MIMEQYGLKFHHVGLAVSKPDLAVEFLKGMGYDIGDRVFDAAQNVNLIFCRSSNAAPDMEIVFPSGNDSPGPLDGMLQANKSRGTFYHMCYETTDLEKTLEEIRLQGLKVLPVSGKTPAILFDNKDVIFLLIRGFGLIEIIENKTEPAK